MPDPIVEKIKEFHTTVVADALSYKFKVPNGGFIAGIKMHSPEYISGTTKIVGRVFTVKIVRNNDDHSLYFQGFPCDDVPRGAVVFFSQPAGTLNSAGGDNYARRLQYQGAAGSVIDGRVRDLQGYRDIKYPLFVRDQATTAGREVNRVSEIQVPVKVNSSEQDVWVRPNDIIIADIDGVVCIPQELAEKVIECVPHYLEADAKTAEGIAKGMTLQECVRLYPRK